MKKELIKRKTNTIEKLEDALFVLLSTKELADIKTRELCVLAKVNHQTFYNYYYDQLDLYEDVEKKAINESLSIINSAFSNNSKDALIDFIQLIKKSHYFIKLFKQKNTSLFKESLLKISLPILEKEIRVMSREKDRRYLALYIFNGTLSIIEEWIKNNCKDDSEYIASLIYKIPGSIDIYH